MTKLTIIAAKCREKLDLCKRNGFPSGCEEAGWRFTLAAIEWLDGMTPQVREAVEKEIIAAWEDCI